MTYTLIGGLRSRGFRVAWMLDELGQPYDHIDVRPHAPEVLAYNPLGKIPVLLDGETALTDSIAILTYLADKHGQLTFPPGTEERARQDAITNFLIDDLDGVIFTLTKHSFGLPTDLRLPQIADTLRWEVARAETRLTAMLGDGPYLMGDRMTIPDIVALHCLNWGVGAKLTSNPRGLRDYGKRLRDRPAYKAAWARRGDG